MDCRNCQPALLELIAGELASETARAARAHLQGCANCRGEFDKLSRSLELASALERVAPPPQVGERLMAMAEAHTLAERRRVAAESAPLPIWRSWLDFLSRFAMARQVGMAMITLLIVAVGLWSLPQLKHAPTARTGTVVNPDSEGEAAPSPGVRPADRLDLKVDVRAGRIRSKDEETRVASAPAPVEPAKLADNAQANEAAAPKVATTHDPARALDDLDSVFEPSAERAQKRAATSQPMKEAKAEGTLARQAAASRSQTDGARLGGGARLADRKESVQQAFPASAAPAPTVASSQAVTATGIGSVQADAQKKPRYDALSTGDKRKSAEVGDVAAAAGPAQQAAPQQAAPQQAAPQQAVPARASARGAPSATEQEARSPVAMLLDARTLARERGCGAAIASYEQVVAAAPGTAVAGSALIEMAQCKRTLGDEAAARALLERATRVAAVAERARALLNPAASQQRPTDSTLNPYR